MQDLLRVDVVEAKGKLNDVDPYAILVNRVALGLGFRHHVKQRPAPAELHDDVETLVVDEGVPVLCHIPGGG